MLPLKFWVLHEGVGQKIWMIFATDWTDKMRHSQNLEIRKGSLNRKVLVFSTVLRRMVSKRMDQTDWGMGNIETFHLSICQCCQAKTHKKAKQSLFHAGPVGSGIRSGMGHEQIFFWTLPYIIIVFIWGIMGFHSKFSTVSFSSHGFTWVFACNARTKQITVPIILFKV